MARSIRAVVIMQDTMYVNSFSTVVTTESLFDRNNVIPRVTMYQHSLIDGNHCVALDDR